MSGSYLLDTNIVIALFNGDKTVAERLVKAHEVFLCTIVVGELYYGSLRSSFKKNNLKKIDDFIASAAIVENNLNTAKMYGSIKNELRKKGTPIPENDIWVAALAKQYNLTLATRDSHFKNIKSLSLEMWQ